MNIREHNELFREEFRGTIPAGYSGVRHGLTLLAIGLAAIAACVLLLASPVRWWDWAMVPLVILAFNGLEWWGHLKVLHRPGKSAFARALYQRHAQTHHRFFILANADLRDARDCKIVFFPLFALPALIVFTAIPAALLAWAGFANAGLMLVLTTTAMYLLFEAIHLASHLPDDSWVARIPLVDTMRRHHRRHHDQAIMMTHNMTFTVPLMDWWFGTWDTGRDETHAARRQAPGPR